MKAFLCLVGLTAVLFLLCCNSNTNSGQVMDLRIVGDPFYGETAVDNCNLDRNDNPIPKLTVVSDISVDDIAFEERGSYVNQYVEHGCLTVDFVPGGVLYLFVPGCKSLPINVPAGIGGSKKYYIKVECVESDDVIENIDGECESYELKDDPVPSNFIETVKGVDFEMVGVQGGFFKMGHVDDPPIYENRDQGPVHTVSLDSYYICNMEVTQKLWIAVMENNPSFFTDDEFPVEYVSWNDVQIFLYKLDSITGKNYRLPTEAEWEYACIGGQKSKGYLYSGSDDIDEVACYGIDLENGSHSKVGTKRPNELGLYDMSGNVYEWCQDWFNAYYYGKSPVDNPKGPIEASVKVIRGGGWSGEKEACSFYYRNCSLPEEYGVNIGFRLALSY